MKRRSEANVQESPTNIGVIIDTSRPTRRRYSKDSARTDLRRSQCWFASCEGPQSPMKFISPKIHKEANNKESTRASYGGAHSGRRLLQDIEEAVGSNDSNVGETGIQYTRKEERPERQEAHDEREGVTINDTITNNVKDIEVISLQDSDETQATSGREPKEV